MAQYVDESDWTAYFGTPVPSGFDRLEGLSVELGKTLSPTGFPTPTQVEELPSPCDVNIGFGILEQMNYYDENPNQLDGVDNSLSNVKIESYSEGLNKPSDGSSSTSIKNQLSPNAFKYWLNCGILYAGIGGC